MTKEVKPIAVYYEHPEWFRPLFAELERRGLPYLSILASQHGYDPSVVEDEYSILLNRMSASAYTRGHGNAIFYTLNYLAHLERTGARVINGYSAFTFEISKAMQLSLLRSLGLSYPKTRVVNSATQLLSAAQGLRFPVVIKPNIGGRGAGIVRYDSLSDLADVVERGEVDLGPDDTGLAQEFIPVRDGHIVRVDTIGGKYLYAIKVFTSGESFNLCPAEFCATDVPPDESQARGAENSPTHILKVESYEPPAEVIEAVEKISAAARLEVGGIEYLVDDRDGAVLYHDINALSNFVANAPQIIGFDPHVRLVDYLEEAAWEWETERGSRYLTHANKLNSP